ncbi:MAG: sulfatase [Flavobacteriaceae bacterium]|nr:MAG: sulfatase [Flavobacteriaceae bacterium]
MQIENNISSNVERKTLKDFIRLVLSFFGCLVILSFFQYIRLYSNGVLDSFLNKSVFILIQHQIGFTSLIAFFIAFIFNFLENKKPRLGFKVTFILLMTFLIAECLLVEYYVEQYEIMGVWELSNMGAEFHLGNVFLISLCFLLVMGGLFYFFHKITSSVHTLISKMYPLTIVLFSLFLTTLISDRKPINESKLQHLCESIINEVFDFNKYEGKEEYPLLRLSKEYNVLGEYFNLKEEKPNLVFIIVDGLGSDFVGDNAIYKGFTPFLDSLGKQSLYWPNYLSNSGETAAAIPTIIGSLPFGDRGFSQIEQAPNRHTLYSILKNNGYYTTFNYGGNSAINHFDKFLHEERVDYIMDNKSFGDSYSKQEEDAAGISLGYPDAELFKKWNMDHYEVQKPRMDVFLTQSTKVSFLIPNHEAYENRVEEVVSKSVGLSKKSKRLIHKNKEIFASVLYTDQSIFSFFKSYKENEKFNNTIFFIVGSHNMAELPQENELSRYKVPLLIYSPMLKAHKTIKSISSHADIAPTLVSLLNERYQLNVPEQVSWLGNSLVKTNKFKAEKEIPLFRSKKRIQDYIYGDYFISNKDIYRITKGLKIITSDNDSLERVIRHKFSYFKAVNKYVTANDKIIPSKHSIFPQAKNIFTKQEMIWVNSVFNGNNVDNAYFTARSLAFNNKRDRALLLCKYILFKVPGHADTEILMGRINGWEGHYENAIHILREAIRKYPTYVDGYSALLDVYFWAGRNEEAINLASAISRNRINDKEVFKKIKRARKSIAEKESNESDKNLQSETITASIVNK